MLFCPGASALHRASPLTKLAMLAVVLAMLPLWPAPVLLAGLGLIVAAAFAMGAGSTLARRLVLMTAPLALALALVQGMLVPRGPSATLGGLGYYPEGMAHALLVFSRLALMMAAGLLFVMTTRAADLARALDAAGLPPALSFLLTAPLSLSETLREEARHLRDGLRLRGLAPTGLRGRARMLAAMVTPLVRNLVVEAPLRAELLEMRGFRALPRRALLSPPRIPRAERMLARALVALALVQLAGLAL